MEANDSVLEYVIGLLPAEKVREAVEHFAGEVKQAVAGIIEQGLPGGFPPGSCKLNQVMQLRVGRLWPHNKLPSWNESLKSPHRNGFSHACRWLLGRATDGAKRCQKTFFRNPWPLFPATLAIQGNPVGPLNCGGPTMPLPGHLPPDRDRARGVPVQKRKRPSQKDTSPLESSWFYLALPCRRLRRLRLRRRYESPYRSRQEQGVETTR